jgi:hemerythrin-like domain-containing protein
MSSPKQDPSEIRTVLLCDHRRLDTLLRKLVAAFEANDREDVQTLWTEFETGLTAHLDAEEEVLLPVLRSTSPDEAQAILADHDRFRARLTELGAGIDLHIVRLETARAFAFELLGHATREDRALYRFADAHLSAPERAALLAKFTDAVRRTTRDLLGASPQKSR